MKKKVEVFDYAGTICKALSRGVLLTTRSGDRVNTMTIGWGKIGVEWGTPGFVAYVRESRYTKQLYGRARQRLRPQPQGHVQRRCAAHRRILPGTVCHPVAEEPLRDLRINRLRLIAGSSAASSCRLNQSAPTP